MRNGIKQRPYCIVQSKDKSDWNDWWLTYHGGTAFIDCFTGTQIKNTKVRSL